MFDPTANGGAGHWQKVDDMPPRVLGGLASLDFYVPSKAKTVHRAVLFGGEAERDLGLDFKYKDLLIAMLMEIVNVIRGHGHDVTAKEYERALNFVAARDRKLPENWLSFDDACWVCGIDPSAAARAIFEDQPGCSRLHLFSVYY
jgi:hypothetical protein